MTSTTAPEPATRLAAAVARLDALIDWERRQRKQMRVSTGPQRELLGLLGDPQAGRRVVHLAGSKGKGSTASLVTAGLVRAGLAAGRYGSPHVERMNERVMIGLAEVGDEALARSIERVLEVRERALAGPAPTSVAEATWFDLVTAAALKAFRTAGVDWIVAECGLGGRLDSTNVLEGEVCVITTIELEHTSVLGSDRASIAREKAGILKPGSTLVTGVPAEDEAGRVIDARALELGVPVLRPELGPSVESMNRALASEALAELGRRGVRDASGRPLTAGLLDPATVAAARLPGRQERFRVGGVPVVLDGAHTPDSVRRLLEDLQGDPGLPGRPVAVLGLALEKDLTGVLKALQTGVDRVVCTSVGSGLHRTPEQIAGEAVGHVSAAETASEPRVALRRALELAAGGGWVLVLGSLYLAGAVRPLCTT